MKFCNRQASDLIKSWGYQLDVFNETLKDLDIDKEAVQSVMSALLSTLPLDQRREVVLQALEGVAGEVVQVGGDESITTFSFREAKACLAWYGKILCDGSFTEDHLVCLAAARAEKRRREAEHG